MFSFLSRFRFFQIIFCCVFFLGSIFLLQKSPLALALNPGTSIDEAVFESVGIDNAPYQSCLSDLQFSADAILPGELFVEFDPLTKEKEILNLLKTFGITHPISLKTADTFLIGPVPKKDMEVVWWFSDEKKKVDTFEKKLKQLFKKKKAKISLEVGFDGAGDIYQFLINFPKPVSLDAIKKQVIPQKLHIEQTKQNGLTIQYERKAKSLKKEYLGVTLSAVPEGKEIDFVCRLRAFQSPIIRSVSPSYEPSEEFLE